MGALTDRVVVVTGAGRGLGREHARRIADEGAAVVVNDSGVDPDGSGGDPAPADSVADEIRARGGRAVAHHGDAADLATARELLALAREEFGGADGLVTNAGILRDRMFVNMSEDDWDVVIRGQLRSAFACCRVFSEYWRGESKAGRSPNASIVTVSSTSGLIGQVGQTNYGAAKAAVAAMTIILAQEIARYGVRVNAITPVARTRMTQDLPTIGEMMAPPTEPGAFDVYHPRNVSPLVAWLLGPRCPANGAVYYAKGGEIRRYAPWSFEWTVDKGSTWTVEELDKELRDRV